MPYLSLEVEGRHKGKPKLPSPRRHNQLMCAINHYQGATCHEHTKMKQLFLPYSELELCNDYILKDPEYIDHFCINFHCHYVLKQVHLDTNLLDNVVLRKEVVQSTNQPKN